MTDIVLDTDTAQEIVEYPDSPYFYQPFTLPVALEWSLVLNALYIEHVLRNENSEWVLYISADLLSTGEREIAIYEEEKRLNLPKYIEPVEYFKINKPVILSFFLSLLIFHIFINYSNPDFYYNRGELSTQKVLDGDWWRAITALTLHSDFQHFAMNAVFGSTFIVVLSYLTGSEFAISLTLISGFYGNLINAFLHKYDFRSIGFSTAVFGTLGIIVGMQLFGKYQLKTSSKRVVLMSAILFFSLFGIGTERVDTGAHFFGLFSGLIIGSVTSFWDIVRHRAFNSFNHILFACCISLMVICWLI